MSEKILVVDDEEFMRDSLVDLLSENEQYNLLAAKSGEEAKNFLEKRSIQVLITDLKMTGITGLELLKWVQTNSPLTETIVITGHGSIDNAVEAMKQGAFNYLTKPFQPETVEADVERALEHHRLKARNQVLETQIPHPSPDKIIGDSSAMQEVFSQLQSIKGSDVTVLITGETGTGKELVARAIHENSPRAKGNFVVVDCGTLPEHIIESELFGHKKGAFTDAHESKTGKFELANDGTLFLDEVGNLPPKMQVKLLRFLEEHQFTPVGANQPRSVDTRVLAATNIDLEKQLNNGNFREDLFYRLNVMSIELPPLRRRKEDIPALASHFLRQYAPELNPEVEGISRETIKQLQDYHWPGNVRELENCIKHALTLSDEQTITPETLPPNIAHGTPSSEMKNSFSPGKTLEEVEKEHILNVIRANDWNLSAATRTLGINRSTLYNKIEKYGLKEEQKE